MHDILHDPRFLSPIVTSVGVMVTITLWLLNLRRKELSYEILSNIPLLNAGEGIEDRLQINFDGRRVHNVHLVSLKVMNSGNVAIRSNEFDGKLTVLFPDNTQVLMAGIEDMLPADLESRSAKDERRKPLIESISGNEVVLRPVMLNRKDYIALKMIVNDLEGEPVLLGHIEGIHAFKQLRDHRLTPFLLGNAGIVLMASALFFIEPSRLSSQSFLEIMPFILMFALGYVLLFLGLYVPKRNKAAFRKIMSIPNEIALRLGTHQ